MVHAARPASARSRTPAAARICPAYAPRLLRLLRAAWRRRTRRRWPAAFARRGVERARISLRVFRTFNANAPAFRERERGAMSRRSGVAAARARSRSTTWRASRARARSPSRSRADGPTEVRLRIFEPPRFFEALLRGRVVTGGARHHLAHLRHLPGRVPDERRATRWRTRSASGSTARSARSGGCSIAASGSRATRSTSSCCTRPDFLGYPDAIAMASDHRDWVSAACA